MTRNKHHLTVIPILGKVIQSYIILNYEKNSLSNFTHLNKIKWRIFIPVQKAWYVKKIARGGSLGFGMALIWDPSQMITCHPKISIERRCSTILPGDIYHIWNIQNIWQGQNASSKQCIRYPDKVPELKTSKAILIFHLSLTDFLYCTLGLPFIVATLHYGYFP